jgi:hypothetical protein
LALAIAVAPTLSGRFDMCAGTADPHSVIAIVVVIIAADA